MAAGPRFIGRIVVQQADRYWIVRERLTYAGSRLVPHAIAIPEQMFSDFGSVPRPLWWWCSPTDPELSAAFLLHDRCYETHCVSRRVADALLYEAARAQGCRATKAWLVWAAVRLFGRHAYRTGPCRQAVRRAAFEHSLSAG